MTRAARDPTRAAAVKSQVAEPAAQSTSALSLWSKLTSLVAVDGAEHGTFWKVVIACLCTMYGLKFGEAVKRSWRLQQRIAALGPEGELFYHSEPWYVAADLVRGEVDQEEQSAKYVAIRDDPDGIIAP